MARGTLHAPKENRRRRNQPAHGEIPLTRDGEIRGPELEDLTGETGWHPAVVRWYETWRRSPQAQAFEETDWSRLGLLAPLVENYVKRPSAAALSEIRMNEERLGATVVDRIRARMSIEESEQDKAPVLEIVDAKERLAARLKEGG